MSELPKRTRGRRNYDKPTWLKDAVIIATAIGTIITTLADQWDKYETRKAMERHAAVRELQKKAESKSDNH